MGFRWWSSKRQKVSVGGETQVMSLPRGHGPLTPDNCTHTDQGRVCMHWWTWKETRKCRRRLTGTQTDRILPSIWLEQSKKTSTGHRSLGGGNQPGKHHEYVVSPSQQFLHNQPSEISRRRREDALDTGRPCIHQRHFHFTHGGT